MANYLLDTDICIFLLKDKHNIKQLIKTVGIENCFISEITIAELTYGAFKSENYEKHLKEVANIEELFGVVPIYECLKKFAKEKARLNKSGRRIPDFDLLIGTTALHRGMILVTNNEKHMARLEDIKIENWTKNTPT